MLAAMLRVRARVSRGRLLVDEPTELPDGSEVELVEAHDLDDADEWPPELGAELVRRYHDVSHGDHISGDELIARLRAR